MKKLLSITLLAAAISACSSEAALEVPTGSDVTLQKKDGVTVAGRLVEVKSESVVVEDKTGVKLEVPRGQIASLRAAAKPEAPADAAATPAASAAAGNGGSAPASEPPAPMYREVTIPAGTTLALDLQSNVSSDTSKIEDPVKATLRRAITVDGVEALPAGTRVSGHVTGAERSGRVKGRAAVSFRFTEIDTPGEGGTRINTAGVTRVAPGTKKRDATVIGGGAVGGAVIGGLLGGGDGAAKGAAIGGAAGTGTVLATRGKEVRLGPGADIAVRLTSPLTVRVPVGR